MYNITKLKADLTGVLHGTTLNQMTNLNGLIDRAARQVLLDVDPQETKRTIDLATAVFNNVFDYPCPTDLKGNKIVDIRPQVNRYPTDVYTQQYNQAFDLWKQYSLQQSMTINFNTAVKTIRLNSPQLPAGVIVNNADGVSNNGTWVVGGTASDIETNNINFAAGGGALQFNLDAGADPSTGYVENTTMSSSDIANFLNQGTFFLYTYLPTATDFDSVTLRWGSSTSDYYSVTTTTTQQNTSFEDGWNLLAFDWLGASVTGTPDDSNISYLRVSYTYDGSAQTGVLLNNIIVNLGRILEIEYYSKYIFRSSVTGAFQETVTDDSNLVNLDTESYNLLFYQVAYLAAQQQQGKNALGFDANFHLNLYKESLARYKAMYKAEVQLPQSQYYALPNNNYMQWWNRRNY